MRQQPKRKIVTEYIPVYYDADTGEEIIDLTEAEKQQVEHESNLKFCKVYSSILAVAKLSLSLRKSTFAVMLYLISTMSYGNKFYYRRNTIAKALGICPSEVTKAYQELVKHHICLPAGDDKLHLVNPEYAFRGSSISSAQRWFNKLQTTVFNKKVKTMTEKEPVHEKVKTTTEKVSTKVATVIAASKRYGPDKKVKILRYLLEKVNTQGVVQKQVNQMAVELRISKATLIPTLNLLKTEGYITRPCRGVVQLLRPSGLQAFLQ